MPLDEPMRDSGPVPKEQLKQLWDIYTTDMGMSPEEILQTPEFREAGIENSAQLQEATEYESQFAALLDAGHFDQAISLAKSLGISGRDLPWTMELLEDYVYEKLRHIPMGQDADLLAAHQAKIEALAVLDISLDEYMGKDGGALWHVYSYNER